MVRTDEKLITELKEQLDGILENWSRLEVKKTDTSPLDMVSPKALEQVQKELKEKGKFTRHSNKIGYAPHWRNLEIAEKLTDRFKYKGIPTLHPRGQFLYKKNGGMSWHTNNESPGIRFYFTYTKEAGKSFFRYQDFDTKEIITDYDKGGWQVRKFTVSVNRPIWHCVESEVDRYSIGFGPND